MRPQGWRQPGLKVPRHSFGHMGLLLRGRGGGRETSVRVVWSLTEILSGSHPLSCTHCCMEKGAGGGGGGKWLDQSKGPYGGPTGGTWSWDPGPPPWVRGSIYKKKVLQDPGPNTHTFFYQIGQFRVCQVPQWAKFEAKYRFRQSQGVHTGFSSRLGPHVFPLGLVLSC